MPLKIS